MDTVFFVFEILGVISFALSGALVALKADMDILGVMTLGIITAIGGGITRDLLLGLTPPSSLINPLNAIIAIAVSIFIFLPFMQKLILQHSKAYDLIFLIGDSIGLGLFTVNGATVSLITHGENAIFLAIMAGIITAVGGGVFRDVLAKHRPMIFVKHFYACASIIGAITYVLGYLIVGELLASIISICLTILLRFLAAKYRWELPKSKYNELQNNNLK